MDVFSKYPSGHCGEGTHPGVDFSNHWMVEKARVFALVAHESVNQRRKYTNDLYLVHPLEVARIRAGRPNATVEDLVTCILHDVIEDTKVTRELIDGEFGVIIGEMVTGMTDVSTLADGNRVIRRAIDNRHVRSQSNKVKANKLCDVLSNIKNIAHYDPGFARKYLPEKKTQLIDGDMRDADPELYDEIMVFIDQFIVTNGISWKPTTEETFAVVNAYYDNKR